MLKNFKKKSLKAKIAIIAFIVFMLALVAYVLYSNFKPEPPAEYEMAQVAYGTVVDTLDVSGTVESGVTENFVAVEGVTVEEVFVKVGDRVHKGDKLASFNVSGAAQYLTAAEKDYKQALAEYNNMKNSSDSNTKKKSELNSKIDNLNAQITVKKKEIAALESEIENSEPSTEQVKIPQEQINAIAAQMAQNGATAEQIEAFISAASQVEVPDVSTVNTEKQQALMQKNLELAQLNSERSALQAENAVTVSTDNTTMLDALKSVADMKKANYESLKGTYDKMSKGWYAENDGIVTVVNVTAGEKFVPVVEENTSSIDLSSLLGGQSVDSSTAAMISSLLGSSDAAPSGVGITVESYDDMIVSVTVSKADLLKIKTGMEATVISLDKEYEGEVIYVGATAAESDGMDLGSITSSLMGGSSSGGAVVKVKIKSPDENVVIGFDVDIKIKLSQIDGALIIPVEAVIYDNGEYSVYVYDSEEGTAVKRIVTKGALDDTNYQITEGLSEGEKVVRSPDPDMEDGTKIKEKTA